MGRVRSPVRRAEHVSFLTRAAISIDVLLADVSSPACGGTCVFLGTVRNGPDEHGVTAIEYSAYEDVIEGVKQRIPVWKKELRVDGSEVWVDPSGLPTPHPLAPSPRRGEGERAHG